MAPNLAVDLPLGTTFIDRFTIGIVPSEQNVVPWHSQIVAISSGNIKRIDNPIIGMLLEEPTMNTQEPVEDGRHGYVREALQIILK